MKVIYFDRSGSKKKNTNTAFLQSNTSLVAKFGKNSTNTALLTGIGTTSRTHIVDGSKEPKYLDNKYIEY